MSDNLGVRRNLRRNSWWLDYYPLLADEDKPIACTLLPGETIYVPSGWWHCILNLEPTVATTQNFVNKENFGFVCLDMAPGYQHKGVCRAGLLALDDGDSEEMEEEEETHDEDDNTLSYSDLTRKEKRFPRLDLPSVTEDEKLPVGTGSNPFGSAGPVRFKIPALPLTIPDVLASGILYFEKGSYKVVPWDGKRIPDIFTSSNLDFDASMLNSEFPFGIWNKTLFEQRNQGKPAPDSFRSLSSQVWPYIKTQRCKGKIFAHLRDDLTWSEGQNLASFLGQQLRNLHLLPNPPVTPPELLDVHEELKIPPEWKVFVDALCQKKKDVTSRLENWGNPIPRALMNKIDEYIPDEFFINLPHVFKDTDVGNEIKPCTWIHSDVMDDNIHMGPYADGDGQHNSWRPSHILDFSDLSIGDPFYDLIPIYLDVFGGDTELFKKLLESYGIPLIRSKNGTVDSTRKKVLSPSYRTM
uniref:JmjC domain-containing protein n=1 Tax=Brassica oleracea var. oleracea TaxID=109376 RepID=A0A0D3ARF7_BRAOL